MGSQRRQSGARHPRSPLPRQQTVREKLKNVQRKPATPIPSPRPPAESAAADAMLMVPAAPRTAGAPASRMRRMYAFSRGYFDVQ